MSGEGQELAIRRESLPQSTPSQLIDYAIKSNAPIAQLTELFALQKQFEAHEAQKAYILAMAEFKLAPPSVIKDKENVQYGSHYASIESLVNTINPHLSAHGFSARWDVDQTKGIQVTCILTHKQGHSERCTMSGPPDSSGKKNPLQEIRSTVTYLKLSTFEAITGIAASGADLSDDGNGSGAFKTDESPAVTGARKKALAATAAEIRLCITKDDDWGAFALYEPITDNEEKRYLWPLLPSNCRSALRRCGEEKERLAAEGTALNHG